MPLIKPFRALRPAAGREAEIIAPPYDVLSSAEARVRAAGKPWSFLHISKPEIDLAPDTGPYAAEVYAKAAENLRKLIDAKMLKRDASPCYYAYRLVREGRPQTGIAAIASVADYETNRIRKHELTTPVKEDDRVRQIEAINAQTGPVLLAYPDAAKIDASIAEATCGEPDADATADDGIRHSLWVLGDPAAIRRLTTLFDALPALYIADGHHRSAAASRVSGDRDGGADAPHRGFLSVVFPAHELLILDYNRLVRDLNGRTPGAFLAEIGQIFSVEDFARPVRPAAENEFGMYLGGRWFRLTLPKERIPEDPVGRLPVTLLSANLIEPTLGIADQRRDKRIDFVGGARGLGELQRRVDAGEAAVAFALHPTSMAALMAVADAGEIMPPKSTWFEPKLADGLVSHMLD